MPQTCASRPRRAATRVVTGALVGAAGSLLVWGAGGTDPCPSRGPDGFDAGSYEVRIGAWPPAYECVFEEREGRGVVNVPVLGW